MTGKDSITVCSECKRASCWLGLFLCEKAHSASTIEVSIEQLQEWKLEHPDYWDHAKFRQHMLPDDDLKDCKVLLEAFVISFRTRVLEAVDDILHSDPAVSDPTRLYKRIADAVNIQC